MPTVAHENIPRRIRSRQKVWKGLVERNFPIVLPTHLEELARCGLDLCCWPDGVTENHRDFGRETISKYTAA